MAAPDYSFFRYDIPLRFPLKLGGDMTLSSRKGFLVRCRAGDAEGWGDIAPLDGYSRETFAEVEREILGDDHLSLPSIRCGLEWAESALREASAGAVDAVEIARLIPRDQSTIDAEPGSTVKVKVGRADVQQDIERVNRLVAGHPELIFRLDANRAWNLDEAMTFARAVDGTRIEFIEEPLKTFADYEAFDRETPVGFALDESLMDQSPWPWHNLRALVIKPTLLGGFSVVDELIQWAQYHDRYAVISSMYESGVGIRRLATLAAERTPGIPAGLDTYSWLADDVVTPRIEIRNGMMLLNKGMQIDLTKVEQVA